MISVYLTIFDPIKAVSMAASNRNWADLSSSEDDEVSERKTGSHKKPNPRKEEAPISKSLISHRRLKANLNEKRTETVLLGWILFKNQTKSSIAWKKRVRKTKEARETKKSSASHSKVLPNMFRIFIPFQKVAFLSNQNPSFCAFLSGQLLNESSLLE